MKNAKVNARDALKTVLMDGMCTRDLRSRSGSTKCSVPVFVSISPQNLHPNHVYSAQNEGNHV